MPNVANVCSLIHLNRFISMLATAAREKKLDNKKNKKIPKTD